MKQSKVFLVWMRSVLCTVYAASRVPISHSWQHNQHASNFYDANELHFTCGYVWIGVCVCCDSLFVPSSMLHDVCHILTWFVQLLAVANHCRSFFPSLISFIRSLLCSEFLLHFHIIVNVMRSWCLRLCPRAVRLHYIGRCGYDSIVENRLFVFFSRFIRICKLIE